MSLFQFQIFFITISISKNSHSWFCRLLGSQSTVNSTISLKGTDEVLSNSNLMHLIQAKPLCACREIHWLLMTKN